MKKLYKFYWDCGRQGDLKGIFIATDDELKTIMDKDLYFGEVLGKHSEIYGILEKDDLSIITDDQKFISDLEKYIGNSFGYNPLNYIRE